MPTIDTPLLIAGRGPAGLVVAKLVSGHGMPSLIVDHEPLDADEPVVLDAVSLAVLEPHGVLGVLRPYASGQDPFTISPALFEQGLKHHCVVDMLVTVYDGMVPAELVRRDGTGVGDGVGVSPGDRAVTGVLSDGKSRWEVKADAYFDASEHDGGQPGALNAAIHAASRFAEQLLAQLA